MKSLLLPIVCAVALAACSKAKQPDPPPPPPAQKTIIDAQLKALQKAKDVQNVVDDQKKKSDKQLDDNGG
ncbi:MAG TPA: hypothetical protein VH082_01775 [Rudaea sp.]|nr:hypothetical protein [Rudaea sp.]